MKAQQKDLTRRSARARLALLVVSFSALIMCTSDRTGQIASPVPFIHREAPFEFEGEPPEGLDALEVRAIDVPRRVPNGGPIRFVIELRNPSEEAVHLDPCPAYQISYGESGTADHLRSFLNCDAAPSAIEADEAILFRMRIPLPRWIFIEGAASGPGPTSRRLVPFTGYLDWTFLYEEITGPDMSPVEVTVEPPSRRS